MAEMELRAYRLRPCRRHAPRTVYDRYWTDGEAQLTALDKALLGVDGCIVSDKHVSPHGISWDDILFFSRLRVRPSIKSVRLPVRLENCLTAMSEQTDVPLLTQLVP